VYFGKVEESAKDCFGLKLPHLHGVTIAQLRADGAQLERHVELWLDDWGIVGPGTGENPFNLRWYRAQQLSFTKMCEATMYLVKDRQTGTAVTEQRDFLQITTTPCNVALLVGARVGPWRDQMLVPAAGAALGVHRIGFCSQWMLMAPPAGFVDKAARVAFYTAAFTLRNHVWVPYRNGWWGRLNSVGTGIVATLQTT
jgi:hypothetical protein